MPLEVVLLPTLTPEQVTQVCAVCDRALSEDAVHPLSEHVRLHLRHGGEGPDRHLLAVDVGDGASAIVGYGHVDPTDLVAGAAAEIVVDPPRRGHGIGRALVKAAIDASPDGRLRLWAHGVNPAARALAASLGFAEGRRLEQWRRPLGEPLPPVELPDGVRLRGFVPGADDEAWLALNARAFADHPEQGSWTTHNLRVRLAESWFDPEGFLIAEVLADDGPPTMIGFHWTKVHGEPGDRHDGGRPPQHSHAPIGEVYVVGVDPAHQGRGLGRSLTLAGLHRLQRAGLHQAMLYVEADNLPARSVYARLGFRHHDTDVMYMLPPA